MNLPLIGALLGIGYLLTRRKPGLSGPPVIHPRRDPADWLTQAVFRRPETRGTTPPFSRRIPSSSEPLIELTQMGQFKPKDFAETRFSGLVVGSEHDLIESLGAWDDAGDLDDAGDKYGDRAVYDAFKQYSNKLLDVDEYVMAKYPPTTVNAARMAKASTYRAIAALNTGTVADMNQSLADVGITPPKNGVPRTAGERAYKEIVGELKRMGVLKEVPATKYRGSFLTINLRPSQIRKAVRKGDLVALKKRMKRWAARGNIGR